MADIAGFYQAFGLKTSRRHAERLDHVVLEFEFMALLLSLEHQAAEGDPKWRNERLQVCRDAESRFFREHLAWWVPAFAHLLGKEAGVGCFYEAVSVFVAALIAAERALFDLPEPGPPAQPTRTEPEACDGCLFA
jgi:TorA maturation chaperone TorD